MVVNVYVEGGVINGNDDATTINNSEALREELNRFMRRALNRDDISIVVKKCSGYKEAAKQFINAIDNEESYLYVDLDRRPELRDEWFKSLMDDGIVMPSDKANHVHFWIQEMEAWFLKQPEAIELWAEDENLSRKPGQNRPLTEHPSIKGKDIEHLQQKASFLMSVILRQVFAPQEKAKRSSSGKVRDLKYGKLRHAPGIIAHLNPTDLMCKDRELRTFTDKIISGDEARSAVADAGIGHAGGDAVDEPGN
ncbi:MAG: DUF4276 family protein [Muribaculaceae bacterium]|nr:DUF4276 family protein [Muribaculaceae bacterium]